MHGIADSCTNRTDHTSARPDAYAYTDCGTTRLCGIMVVVWGQLQEGVQHLCGEARRWRVMLVQRGPGESVQRWRGRVPCGSCLY